MSPQIKAPQTLLLNYHKVLSTGHPAIPNQRKGRLDRLRGVDAWLPFMVLLLFMCLLPS